MAKEKEEVVKKKRKTIQDNPAVLIHEGNILSFDNKEDAETHIKENIKESDTYYLYLLYKTYELDVIVTKTIKSK